MQIPSCVSRCLLFFFLRMKAFFVVPMRKNYRGNYLGYKLYYLLRSFSFTIPFPFSLLMLHSPNKAIRCTMNLFAKHRRRIIELSALTLFICMFSRRITLIHSSTLAPLSSENNNNFSPYLYNSDDSSPVLEQGRLSEIDFTKSKAPKVVEFYNPKCGACQGKFKC